MPSKVTVRVSGATAKAMCRARRLALVRRRRAIGRTMKFMCATDRSIADRILSLSDSTNSYRWLLLSASAAGSDAAIVMRGFAAPGAAPGVAPAPGAAPLRTSPAVSACPAVCRSVGVYAPTAGDVESSWGADWAPASIAVTTTTARATTSTPTAWPAPRVTTSGRRAAWRADGTTCVYWCSGPMGTPGPGPRSRPAGDHRRDGGQVTYSPNIDRRADRRHSHGRGTARYTRHASAL